MDKKKSILLFAILTVVALTLVIFSKPVLIFLIWIENGTSNVIEILQKWLIIFMVLFLVGVIISIILARLKSRIAEEKSYRKRMLQTSLLRHIPFFLGIVCFIYLIQLYSTYLPQAIKQGECIILTDEFPQKIYSGFGTVKYECSRDEHLIGVRGKDGRAKIVAVSETSEGLRYGLKFMIFDEYGIICGEHQCFPPFGDYDRSDIINYFMEQNDFSDLVYLSRLNYR